MVILIGWTRADFSLSPCPLEMGLCAVSKSAHPGHLSDPNFLRIQMNKSLVLASLVAAFALTACGKKEAAPVVAPAPAAAPMAAPVADAASAVAFAASAVAGAASAVVDAAKK